VIALVATYTAVCAVAIVRAAGGVPRRASTAMSHSRVFQS
jgi:hypothetical protein